MDAGRPRPLTVLAAGAMAALTLPFVAVGTSLWAAGADAAGADTLTRLAQAGVDSGFEGTFGRPLTGQDAAFWLRLAGAAVLALCAWSGALALGTLGRREWARHAGLVTFLLFALIAVPHGVGGWFLDPRPEGAASALLAAVGTVSAVWLLATRTVADDVARASFYRARRRRRSADSDEPDSDGPGDPPILAA